MKKALVAGVLALGLFSLVGLSQAQPSAPDIRFVLQAQAGLSAYSQITDTISLNYIRPIFSTIEFESADYILGNYTLSGSADVVKLALGSAGWAVAYHTRDYYSALFYDCGRFDSNQPAQMINRPERAIAEVASALGITSTVTNYYDFRNPQATGLIQHWLFLLNSGTRNSTITLPLGNTYLERGYVFCTALSNSKFLLNNVILDQSGYGLVFHWGFLTPDQLRAGQTNTMQIQATTIFGTGFVGGVTAVYSGTTPIDTAGGYRRDFSLAYPPMLGGPIEILTTHLPIIRR